MTIRYTHSNKAIEIAVNSTNENPMSLPQSFVTKQFEKQSYRHTSRNKHAHDRERGYSNSLSLCRGVQLYP